MQKTILTLILSLGTSAFAQDATPTPSPTPPPPKVALGPVSFAWNANPESDHVDGYHWYENGNNIDTTDQTTATINDLPVGLHTLALTAYRDSDGTESLPAHITFEMVANAPGAPQGIQIISGTKLANVSTRGQVGTGDGVLIAGTIVSNGGTLIARALGPSLALPGAVADPTLELHDASGALIASNAGWKNAPNESDLVAAQLAPTNDHESAILVTVAPGAYTAIVRGKDNTTGLGLVEFYAANN